jgi:glycosyltransferase involved in cell wall biosynthesis
MAKSGQRFSVGIMGRVLDQRDGLGLYARQLLESMFTLDGSTRYVLLLARAEHAKSFQAFSNVEVHVLPSRSKLLWDQVTVPWAARRLGLDVLFNPKFSVPLLTGLPCIFVLQGADWYVNPRNYPWWDNLYIRLMLPLYCRKATRLLCISQATLNDLAKHISFDADRAVVTYAGVAQNFTAIEDPDAAAQFRTRYGLPPQFILTVARAYHTGHTDSPPYPGGNIERLTCAFHRYRIAGGALPLVVVGHRIEEYLRARGFSDIDLAGVQFLGFVPNSTMHLAYQSATCFVLATLCESFGLPILEALATGCPAIVPNTCAAPEVAGGAARLVNPLEEKDITRALAEITGSESERLRMRVLGLERAKAFSWTATAQRTTSVIREFAP